MRRELPLASWFQSFVIRSAVFGLGMEAIDEGPFALSDAVAIGIAFAVVMFLVVDIGRLLYGRWKHASSA